METKKGMHLRSFLPLSRAINGSDYGIASSHLLSLISGSSSET